VFDGYLHANVARETSYFGPPVARETNETRYTLSGSHNYTISPSFKLSASGQYQSDPRYYQDFSSNLDQRLNRTLHSQASFFKRFSDNVSLSGSITHDDNLDTKSRTTRIPSLGLSLPVFKPFGSGTTNEEGRLVSRWYNNVTVTYRPSLLNYYNRVNIDSVFNEVYDTTGVVDSLISADTLSYFSRRKYTRFDHSLTLRMPFKVAKYFVFNPGLTYSENWYKIYSTDQSEALGISSSTIYRAYLYTLGTSLETKLYGTVYPNALGLIGLRQVITPRVSYSYVPEINRNPEVRSYAGGGSGSAARRQSIQVSLSHDYQAKIAAGEGERNLELLSISHTFSYDLENTVQPYSNLVTTYRSNVLPRITLFGNMTHTFYKPGTNELHFWSPYLLSYDLNASMSFSGRSFLFDDPDQIPKGADSASQLSESGADTYTGTSSGSWNMSVTFSHAETGRGSQYVKTSFIRFSLSFNLTPETSVQYSQYYDFVRSRTINNQVRIVRRLKCWTGELYWVPIGSNKGYGFRLYVTAIPSIKIDNSQNPFRSSYFQ
jgi:hypothetical protein